MKYRKYVIPYTLVTLVYTTLDYGITYKYVTVKRYSTATQQRCSVT